MYMLLKTEDEDEVVAMGSLVAQGSKATGRTFVTLLTRQSMILILILLKMNRIKLPPSDNKVQPGDEKLDRFCRYCRKKGHGTRYCFDLRDVASKTR